MPPFTQQAATGPNVLHVATPPPAGATGFRPDHLEPSAPNCARYPARPRARPLTGALAIHCLRGSLGQTSIGAFFSDMTYYTDAAIGAGVLDTGTNNWIPALDDYSGCHPGGICESTMVQHITANIFKLFGQGPAARHQPSVPNWRQVTGQ